MNTQIPLWVTLLSMVISFCAALVPAFITRNSLFKQLTEQREMMERQFREQRENLDRQLKVQLATSLDKEWLQNVRLAVNQYMDALWYLWNIRTTPPPTDKILAEQMQKANLKYGNDLLIAKNKCSTLLDARKAKEKELIGKINKIHNSFNSKGDGNNWVPMKDYTNELVEAVHDLADSIKPIL